MFKSSIKRTSQSAFSPAWTRSCVGSCRVSQELGRSPTSHGRFWCLSPRQRKKTLPNTQTTKLSWPSGTTIGEVVISLCDATLRTWIMKEYFWSYSMRRASSFKAESYSISKTTSTAWKSWARRLTVSIRVSPPPPIWKPTYQRSIKRSKTVTSWAQTATLILISRSTPRIV